MARRCGLLQESGAGFCAAPVGWLRKAQLKRWAMRVQRWQERRWAAPQGGAWRVGAQEEVWRRVLQARQLHGVVRTVREWKWV